MIKLINVNLNDEKSIIAAEVKKAALENAGFKLQQTVSCLNRAELIYYKGGTK